MKNLKNYFLSLLFIPALFSCSDEFLEIDPEQNVASNSAIVDLPTMNAAITGVYNNLQDNDYYGRSVVLIPELMADNVFVSVQNAGRYLDYDAFIVRDTDGYASGSWSDIYEVIVNSNQIINSGLTIDFNDQAQTKANQLIGEAYAIRALAYFDLLRLFAQPYNFTSDASHPGVPVFTDSEPGIRSPQRGTVKEGYDQVINDLTEAVNLMSNETASGYASKSAAQALLARVYLYMENWQGAIDMASTVINSGYYTLLKNEEYADAWKSDFSSESIFEVINTNVDNAGTNTIGYFFDQNGYGDGIATADLYNSFSNTDVRADLITVGSRASGESTAHIIEKYNIGESRDNAGNVVVIRLSELYLIRAEAYAELGGAANEARAQEDLNTIVQRADKTALPITLSGDALVQRIIEERRKELAFEGHRLWDLNRKGYNVDIIQSDNVIPASYPNNRFILPIPQREIDSNPNITEADQNPGY